MRQDLPSGTITLLFTDVEGSTKLLHEVGDERYSLILAEHHRLCRQAWHAHRGVEVETEGDAFFVVFEDAADALRGAEAAQRLLADGPLKVRMGMHTGPVLLVEIDSDSVDCRVMMAQCELLLERAEAARALLRDVLPAVVDLSDGMVDVMALRVIAMLATASGLAETSAVLFGAADRML
jgi:hypothetical protein